MDTNPQLWKTVRSSLIMLLPFFITPVTLKLTANKNKLVEDLTTRSPFIMYNLTLTTHLYN